MIGRFTNEHLRPGQGSEGHGPHHFLAEIIDAGSRDLRDPEVEAERCADPGDLVAADRLARAAAADDDGEVRVTVDDPAADVFAQRRIVDDVGADMPRSVVVLSHLEGRTKSGNEIKLPSVEVYRMRDGKANRVQTLTDTAEMKRALGR